MQKLWKFFITLGIALLLMGCGKRIDIHKKTIMIRCDDIGMCHGVNSAAQRLIDRGIPFSASVMFCCPWYQEAVQILKDQTQVSVGVHLTLNAEWKNYRWGPVAGAQAVPGLVNEQGFFYPSRKILFDNAPPLEEIEIELRAQIERALSSGLKIDYLDYHMGAAVSSPELVEMVESLAREYKLGISRWYGEQDVQGIYSTEPEHKLDTLTNRLHNLPQDEINLLVFHIGSDTPEMQALEDLNEFGLKNMSKHRKAETDAVCSSRFCSFIEENNFKLINYTQLLEKTGRENWQRPDNFDY